MLQQMRFNFKRFLACAAHQNAATFPFLVVRQVLFVRECSTTNAHGTFGQFRGVVSFVRRRRNAGHNIAECQWRRRPSPHRMILLFFRWQSAQLWIVVVVLIVVIHSSDHFHFVRWHYGKCGKGKNSISKFRPLFISTALISVLWLISEMILG